MNKELLAQTARSMVARGKGILAADESNSTCGKRFEKYGVPSTPENRRQYRQALLTAPGLEEYISGVILYDETLRQTDDAGTPFAQILLEKGILPGIKVDTGAKPLALHAGETVTEGLDGLRERLAEYAELGAKFAKWRAVITIDAENSLPSDACIAANAAALARYAALCQEAGIVPIVEPEVLMDGRHDLLTCEFATRRILAAVFEELEIQGVYLPGIVLKPNMLVPGMESSQTATAEEIAETTTNLLREAVPAEVPGIAFLSGGQSMTEATANLQAINEFIDLPWLVTYSYGRALQNDALKIWAADPAGSVAAAQAALLQRAKLNSLASTGEYSAELEQA